MDFTPRAHSEFERGLRHYVRFWCRLGIKPPLAGMTIADLGCGHGSMCFRLARDGAARVVGIDTNAGVIEYARCQLAENYPDFRDKIHFHHGEFAAYDSAVSFDYVVSKDTFEHVNDPGRLLDDIRRRLKPGGLLLLGFGPLYNSPLGDHHGAEIFLPWGHVLFNENWLVTRLNRRRTNKIKSICDLGMNGLSYETYKRLLAQCGLTLIHRAVNRGEGSGLIVRLIYRLFLALSGIPALCEYLTINLYAVLRKPF